MFYALTKVHKDLNNPPGRFIISGNGCISEGISQVIDSHLRPRVTGLASYVKDSLDFLKMVDGLDIPKSEFLVTVDVESLYNSIQHNKGIAAVKYVLQ